MGADAATLVAQFDLFEAPDWTPRYNIAPTQEAPTVVIASADPRRGFKLHRWGLIPSWAKDPGIGSQMINAQAETVATKPAFRAAFRKEKWGMSLSFSISLRRRGGDGNHGARST